MSKFSLFIVLLFCCYQMQAQEVWTLEKCLKHVAQNHPIVLQSELDLREVALDYQSVKNRRLPSLSAGTDFGMQFGRTVDPTTNVFDNQSISYNGWSVNANWNIFSGGLKERILEQKQRMNSSKWAADESIFLLQLDVIAAYYACLLAESQLEQAKLNSNSLEEQIRNMQKQVDSGTRSVTDRMELEAQFTQSKQTEVQSKYRLRQQYNDLKNTLFLPPSENFNIAKEEDIVETVNFKIAEIEAQYPGILAQQANIEAAEIALQGSQKALLPDLSLFGNLGTNYSSAIANKGYFAQLNENFGQGLGLSVSIPILNQGSNNINQQRAEISLKRSKIALQQNQQILNFALQQISQDLNAAQEILKSAQTNLDLQGKLEATKKRAYQLGVSNQLDYLIARNQYQTAVQTYLAAKYDYAYQLKIANFYQQNGQVK